MTNKDKSLEEIVDAVIRNYNLKSHTGKFMGKTEALAQINNLVKEQMLSLIGEAKPDKVMEVLKDGSKIVERNPVNNYIAELRAAINERFK